MLTNDQLEFFNRQGLIPGPDEPEEEFQRRVEYCFELKKNLPNLFENVSLEDIAVGDGCIQQAFPLTKKLFDLVPVWIPLFFSDYKLSPWHGGCAWIFQLSDETSYSAFFQLRQSFRKSTRYLGIYDRNELIAHELTHAARMLFQEPRFEEIIAYQSASSAFRRWFGPIIQTTSESMIFALSLALVLLLEVYAFFTKDFAGMEYSLMAALIPLSLFCLGLGRLWNRQRQYGRCLQKLSKLLKNENQGIAMTVRMTDREICAFSNWELAEIQKYIEENRTQSLRWKMISQAYL